jgi:hypothetical protein
VFLFHVGPSLKVECWGGIGANGLLVRFHWSRWSCEQFLDNFWALWAFDSRSGCIGYLSAVAGMLGSCQSVEDIYPIVVLYSVKLSCSY